MPGPLAGIRVLDLSSVVLGPLATQIMGDLGADVIKIEGPEGDTTRATGPGRSDDMAAIFMGFNRNKRSLVLDLKQQTACDALWKLIETADVFVHSIRPQKIAKLGFGLLRFGTLLRWLSRQPGVRAVGIARRPRGGSGTARSL